MTEAAQLLDEALAIRRKALGNDHPQVASTLTVQANLFVGTQQYDEALDATTEALRILALSLPDDHWLVAMARNVQGAALAGLGKYPEAEKLLLASLPALVGLADPRPAAARPRPAGGPVYGLGQTGRGGKVRPLGPRSCSHNAGQGRVGPSHSRSCAPPE